MIQVAPTTRRVQLHSPAGTNDRIRRQTEMNVAYFASHPDQIARRLKELDDEWDVERFLETGASSLVLVSGLLRVLGGRRISLVGLAVPAFLLQHAISGWCPPIELLRRAGVRTESEIHAERTALKALRGDFEDIGGDPTRALEAALR